MRQHIDGDSVDVVCEGRQPRCRVQTLVAHLSSDTEHKLEMGRDRGMSKLDVVQDIACVALPRVDKD